MHAVMPRVCFNFQTGCVNNTTACEGGEDFVLLIASKTVTDQQTRLMVKTKERGYAGHCSAQYQNLNRTLPPLIKQIELKITLNEQS